MGRLPAEDPQDERFLMRAALEPVAVPVVKPPYRHWTPGDIIHQGRSGKCVGAAWRAFLESSPIRVKRGIGPDWHAIYYEAQRRDEWPGAEPDYEGTSVRAGAKAVEAFGHLQEYRWARAIQDVADWVLLISPVVVGTVWTTAMFEPDRNGFIRPTGTVEGGHAYTLLGYNARTKLFRCQNSWGSGWGQGGRFWIREADLDALLFERGGEACAATEQIAVGGVP